MNSFVYMAINTELTEGWYKLKDLKKGEPIKLKPESKTVWIRGAYIREDKKYELECWHDINKMSYKKGDIMVWAGFTF